MECFLKNMERVEFEAVLNIAKKCLNGIKNIERKIKFGIGTANMECPFQSPFQSNISDCKSMIKFGTPKVIVTRATFSMV